MHHLLRKFRVAIEYDETEYNFFLSQNRPVVPVATTNVIENGVHMRELCLVSNSTGTDVESR